MSLFLGWPVYRFTLYIYVHIHMYASQDYVCAESTYFDVKFSPMWSYDQNLILYSLDNHMWWENKSSNADDCLYAMLR